MRKIIQLEQFEREFSEFSKESREDIFALIDKYLNHEMLTPQCFKTFKIDKRTRIQEFKVKDHRGNWCAISCHYEKDYLVLVYAFHKKSQQLLDKDKEVIRNRIRRIDI